MASKLRTLSSVAPELASWLILNNTDLNFSPEDIHRKSTKDHKTSAKIKIKISDIIIIREAIVPLGPLTFMK